MMKKEKGASFEVYGLPEGPTLNIKQMKMIKNMIKTVDFRVSPNNMMMFKGDSVRGAIAGRV